jgi:hypothetical protein
VAVEGSRLPVVDKGRRLTTNPWRSIPTTTCPMPLHVDIHALNAVTSGNVGESASWQKPRAA